MNLVDRYVTSKQEGGYLKLLGKIISVNNETLIVESLDDSTDEYSPDDVYLEASRSNLEDYLSHGYTRRREKISDSIRVAVSRFNGGINKRARIETLKNYFQSKNIKIVGGNRLSIKNNVDVTKKCANLDRPYFIFNDNGQASWAEKGFKDYGPYTKRTFDRNDPSVCVICTQHGKGRVEQFVRKFLKGIPGHKYYSSGFEGKFSLGTSSVHVITTTTNDVAGYRSAIETAIKKKSDEGSKWDLALVQIQESFKKLDVNDNPYYVGKSLFFLHQVPVQDFTIELLRQNDYLLGYSMNNMALASYAKMGGVPWLLKSSPTLSHELVVGIGSAKVGIGRRVDKQRVMGITTVFSGDGSYLISNTSKAVSPDDYCDALSTVLSETIEKIKNRMNWQTGDTIRLIFHASVKKFNKDLKFRS